MEDKKPVNKKLMVLPLILGISSFARLRFIFTVQTMPPIHIPTLYL